MLNDSYKNIDKKIHCYQVINNKNEKPFFW